MIPTSNIRCLSNSTGIRSCVSPVASSHYWYYRIPTTWPHICLWHRIDCVGMFQNQKPFQNPLKKWCMLVGYFSPAVSRNIHVLCLNHKIERPGPQKTPNISGTDQTGMGILTYPYGYGRGLLDDFSARDLGNFIQSPGCLLCIADEILASNVGIIINRYKDPYEPY